MGETTTMRYYEYGNGIILAKVGDVNARHDIFRFDKETNHWIQLSINDDEWVDYYAQFNMKTVELPKEILEREGIQFIEKIPPDKTQLFSAKYSD